MPASIEAVSRFVEHSSPAVTATYLGRLEGQEDQSWEKVAAAIGYERTGIQIRSASILYAELLRPLRTQPMRARKCGIQF